jgi:TRAP transporter 4TM/12TM fusion protein
VLGAAAFLIAEYLKISYLSVIQMAVIPTVLYYFSIFVMVEVDARKQGGAGELLIGQGQLWALTRDYWFHFLSLISIVIFMLLGFSPVLSVFWATILALSASALRADCAIVPWWIAVPLMAGLAIVILDFMGVGLAAVLPGYEWVLIYLPILAAAVIGLVAPRIAPMTTRFANAMKEGTTGVLNVAATCATAGIIVGVVTLTGLAQRFADIIIGYAQGSLLLTTIFTAAIVWIVGLAVPVTASYIMCAVIAAPALIKLGVPDFAAHMFIFYYAVLSEVSPPTALSPFAAAAITGGNPYKTTLQSWKYTMPAFIVPFAFVLEPEGVGLLLKTPKGGDWMDIAEVAISATLGILALAAGLQGWLMRKTSTIERALLIVAGFLFVMPAVFDVPIMNVTGHHLVGAHAIALALAVVAIATQWVRRARVA